MEKLDIKQFCKDFYHITAKNLWNTLKHVSMESINWVALLLLHAVTVPTMFGLMTGLTDKAPPIDMVLILWAAMTMLFFKAILQKDIIPVVIIGAGFIGQAVMLALVFFK